MNDEAQPPRLQDTTERSALPLPLPGSEDGEEPAQAGSSSEDAEVDPLFAPPAAASFAGQPAEAGPPPEVLVGAAFLGGVALAFVLKRLGS